MVKSRMRKSRRKSKARRSRKCKYGQLKRPVRNKETGRMRYCKLKRKSRRKSRRKSKAKRKSRRKSKRKSRGMDAILGGKVKGKKKDNKTRRNNPTKKFKEQVKRGSRNLRPAAQIKNESIMNELEHRLKMLRQYPTLNEEQKKEVEDIKLMMAKKAKQVKQSQSRKKGKRSKRSGKRNK